MSADREVHGYGQGGTPPVGEGAGDAVILLDEEAADQIILRLVLNAARPALEALPIYPYRNLRVVAEVLPGSERSRPSESM